VNVDTCKLLWFKGSRSSSTSVPSLENDRMAVNDSKDPDGPMLIFNRDEWQAFVEGVKLG